jgi:hypothetical protein
MGPQSRKLPSQARTIHRRPKGAARTLRSYGAGGDECGPVIEIQFDRHGLEKIECQQNCPPAWAIKLRSSEDAVVARLGSPDSSDIDDDGNKTVVYRRLRALFMLSHKKIVLIRLGSSA